MRVLSLALVLAGLAACGDSRSSTAPRASSEAGGPRSVGKVAGTLKMGCQNSFAPTLRFLGGRHWRRVSTRLGPVTLVRAARPGWGQHERNTFVQKVPILIRPKVRVRLELALPHRMRGGFFFSSAGGLVTAPPSEGKRVVEVGPCPRIPPIGEPPDTGETGIGLFVTASRRGCAKVTARWRDRETTAQLRLGVRRCSPTT